MLENSIQFADCAEKGSFSGPPGVRFCLPPPLPFGGRRQAGLLETNNNIDSQSEEDLCFGRDAARTTPVWGARGKDPRVRTHSQ